MVLPPSNSNRLEDPLHFHRRVVPSWFSDPTARKTIEVVEPIINTLDPVIEDDDQIKEDFSEDDSITALSTSLAEVSERPLIPGAAYFLSNLTSALESTENPLDSVINNNFDDITQVIPQINPESNPTEASSNALQILYRVGDKLGVADIDARHKAAIAIFGSFAVTAIVERFFF